MRKYEEELNRSNAVTRINAMFGMGNGEIKGGTSGLGTVAVKPEFLDVKAGADTRQAGYDKVRQNSLGLLLEDIQPPSGGCELKLIAPARPPQRVLPAAFGRL